MSNYYNAAVCINGHIIDNTLYDEDTVDNFCNKCGGKIVTTCSNCGTKIRGQIISRHIVVPVEQRKPHSYCHECGNPYPWTEKAIFAMMKILREEKLDNELISSIEDSIPDMLSETPGSSLAVIRLKKILSAVGKVTGDTILKFVVTYGCEAVITALNL